MDDHLPSPLRRLPLLVALVAGLLPACKSDPAPGAAPGSASPASTAALAPAAATEDPAISKAARALGYLPAETLALAVTADPADLARRLGRDAVVKAIPELYAKAATEVREHTGTDLLDPDRWADIGVDPHGPAGTFFLGARDTGGFFFSLQAEDKLIALLKKIGGERVEVRAVGEAKLVGPPRRDPVLVLRGGVAFVVVGRNVWAEAWAQDIASLPPERSLAQDAEFQKSTTALRFGRDVSGFVATQRLGDFVIDAMSRQEGAAVVDRFIEAARQRGDEDTAAELSEHKDRKGRTRDRIAAGAIKALIIGGMGPLVLGARVEDDVVRVRLDMGLGEGALPRRVLLPGGGASPLAALAGPDFLFLLGGRVNVDGTIGLIRSIALAVGEADDLERDRRRFEEELGFDPEAGLLRALSGDVGLALTEQDPSARDEKRLGFVAHGGVANAAALDKSLAAMAAHRELKELVTTVPGGFRLSIPDWHAVEVRTGPTLFVTTDVAALERKAPVGQAAALAALLTQPGLSALGALDIARSVKMTTLRSYDWEPPEPELQRDTPEAQAALKAWRAIQAELTADRKAREAKTAEFIDRMVSPLGHLAAAARLTERGLEVEGGFFLRQSTVPQAMASLAREAAAMEAMQRESYRKSEDLYRRLGEARQQLQAVDQPALEGEPADDDGKDAPAPRDVPPSDDKME